MHTLRNLEEKEHAIPVIVIYEDEAGGKRDTLTMIIMGALVPITRTQIEFVWVHISSLLMIPPLRAHRTQR